MNFVEGPTTMNISYAQEKPDCLNLDHNLLLSSIIELIKVLIFVALPLQLLLADNPGPSRVSVRFLLPGIALQLH